VPSATSAVMIGDPMLFSPSAYFGGTAAPMAWRLARTQDEPLLLQLGEAQEPALTASAEPGEPGESQQPGRPVARRQRVTQAASGAFSGWPTGSAADGTSGRVQTVMELPGASPRPRLTGPLLLRGTAGPGPAGSCGACPRVAC
jgi:hypothetical protein